MERVLWCDLEKEEETMDYKFENEVGFNNVDDGVGFSADFDKNALQAADLVAYSVEQNLVMPVRTCALCGKNFVLESFTDFSSICPDCKALWMKIKGTDNDGK